MRFDFMINETKFMKTLAIVCLLILNSVLGYSCTTFVLKSEKTLVFGRNLDWVSDNGLVVVNKRNIIKESLVFPPEKSTKWTSKYGSITFNQFGKEFPFGGINEKGLVVEIMLVPGEYPAFDNRTAVNELQWIQYQLDNFETIEGVIGSDKDIRISRIDKNIHFLICDSFGNVAVIEFDRKGMKVYTGRDLPIAVLENDTYSRSLEKHKRKKTCRFSTAANMVDKFQPRGKISAVDYSFQILDKVALDGSWSIVYDLKNMEIHFKTSTNKILRKIRIRDFDFSCEKEAKLYDLKTNDKGFINKRFASYTAELNNRKFMAAIKSNRIQLHKNVLAQFYNVNEDYHCTEK